ncbi:MAG TPA: ferric reductase-like transmembrane domain-containing protein [Candidatus Sulfotelmatobacter sp.]|nr:ferric reductase-like transmembrane domain-containing protein [Candidatus Sulfotelmatobacter sp.]
MWPWLDDDGRVSPLKSATLIALVVPAALVAWDWQAHALGARPLNQAIHEIGNWTIKLVLLALAVTPARRVLDWPRVLVLRRMIGVAAFAYAATHLTLYALDQGLDLVKVATEIALRFYLTIGFVALAILAALAATSTDGMMRRLGARRWRRLHRLVYPAALLGVIHFFIQTKANVDEPWVMAGLLAWLMLYRALAWRRGSDRKVAARTIALLAPLAALLTALGEAVYYWIKLGVDPLRVLGADLSLATGVRPAWIVLAIALALSAGGALRGLAHRLPRRAAA